MWPSRFFGVRETWDGVPQLLAGVAEAAAVVLAAAALLVERGRPAADGGRG